jgi:plasmid stabilization system protein ParE
MRLIFTPEAADALNNIYEFIRLKNERAAVAIHNEIIDEIERLTIYPQIAPIEPTLAESVLAYRALVVRRVYKVIYRIDGQKIYVVDIWDCRQNPESLKRGVTGQKQ